MLPEGGELHELFFGTVYFGQRKTIKAVLVNNSPVPSTFSAGINLNVGAEETKVRDSARAPASTLACSGL